MHPERSDPEHDDNTVDGQSDHTPESADFSDEALADTKKAIEEFIR